MTADPTHVVSILGDDHLWGTDNATGFASVGGYNLGKYSTAWYGFKSTNALSFLSLDAVAGVTSLRDHPAYDPRNLQRRILVMSINVTDPSTQYKISAEIDGVAYAAYSTALYDVEIAEYSWNILDGNPPRCPVSALTCALSQPPFATRLRHVGVALAPPRTPFEWGIRQASDESRRHITHIL
ncbi:hypothetical protein K438DRAFT_1770794 [Mycena galopus ATCC 62051]|nr:hypothetical protein K438DRAFT_1770794 [Mycena galopus ATCC 62051]